METFFVTGVMTLMASYALAQTPDSVPASTRSTAAVEAGLATPTGHEVTAGVASYTYREPGAQAISIHGAKFTGDYTGTLSLNKRRHWFAQAELSGTLGNGAHERRVAWGAERQPGIRSADPRLAADPRLGFGRWRCSSDEDGACVYHRWLYGCLVLSVRRMGAACKCEVSGDQALVGGAVLCALARQLLAGEL